MINKDYILRLAERFGRELAIILRLRERNDMEEALIYIDDLLLQTTGLTSGFINSLSIETLLQLISPLGTLDIEKGIWIAALLKAEADIYGDQEKENESYHRYLKSLYLYLEILFYERIDVPGLEIATEVQDILHRLEEYQLPLPIQNKVFRFYEYIGNYARAEDTLYDMLDIYPDTADIFKEGQDFYARLLKKSDADLLTGNLSRDEVNEGLTKLRQLAASGDQTSPS